jgi:hypothetical protein
MKEERFILLTLQRIQSMVSWLHCFGPEVKSDITVVGEHGGGGWSPCGSQKAKRETGKGWGQDRPFKGMAPVATSSKR